jgi:hypothetical protein
MEIGGSGGVALLFLVQKADNLTFETGSTQPI